MKIYLDRHTATGLLPFLEIEIRKTGAAKSISSHNGHKYNKFRFLDKLEMTENKLEMTENKLEMTENKLEMTENKLEMTENKLEMTENKLEMTENKLEMTIILSSYPFP